MSRNEYQKNRKKALPFKNSCGNLNVRGIMANFITGIRIVCALLLLFCPMFSKFFYLFYALGGISDILDGFVARHLGQETRLGAQLDTAADIVFTSVVLIKTVRTVNFPLWLTVWIIAIAVFKCVNMVFGFIRYKRFFAEHTVLNKLCGLLLFAIPLCIGLFPWQPVAVLIVFSCILATAAAVQEGSYIRRGKETD